MHVPPPPVTLSSHSFEPIGEEGAEMLLEVKSRTLGQDSPHTDVRNIGLLHELTRWVQMNQDGSCGQQLGTT
jgi:hypothetical protein